MGQPLDAAWSAYQAALETLRQRLLSLQADPNAAWQAHRLLLEAQAAAYNLVIAPQLDRPRFQSQTVFSQPLYDWIMPNPDFLYRYAFVAGDGTYEIAGRVGNSHFLDAQVIRGFFGDPAIQLMQNHDLRKFAAADGTFRVTLSATPPADRHRWIPLASGAMNTVIVRECFYDWQAETASSLDIRALGTPGPAAPLGEVALIDRLGAAARMMDFCSRTFGPEFCHGIAAQIGENRFLLLDTHRDEDAANPKAAYIPAAYRLDHGTALVIGMEVPKADYWSLHLTDRWSRTLDYADHQSSLNGRQLRVDGDGRVRIVVALTDPGVANWLDPVGVESGMILLRWYGNRGNPVPAIDAVPLDQLDPFLPPDTARVSAADRAGIVRRRRQAVLARQGV